MPKSIINPNDILTQKFGKLTIDEYLGVEYSGRNRNHRHIGGHAAALADALANDFAGGAADYNYISAFELRSLNKLQSLSKHRVSSPKK